MAQSFQLQLTTPKTLASLKARQSGDWEWEVVDTSEATQEEGTLLMLMTCAQRRLSRWGSKVKAIRAMRAGGQLAVIAVNKILWHGVYMFTLDPDTDMVQEEKLTTFSPREVPAEWLDRWLEEQAIMRWQQGGALSLDENLLALANSRGCPSPTQLDDNNLACAYCGMRDFPTLMESLTHELVCEYERNMGGSEVGHADPGSLMLRIQRRFVRDDEDCAAAAVQLSSAPAETWEGLGLRECFLGSMQEQACSSGAQNHPCARVKRCAKCRAARAANEFSSQQWKRAAATRQCLHCMGKEVESADQRQLVRSVSNPTLFAIDASASLKMIPAALHAEQKLECIVTACEQIMKDASQLAGSVLGADDLVPLLMCCVAQARIPNLQSQLRYVEATVPEAELTTGKYGYYYLTLDLVCNYMLQLHRNE